MNLRVERLSAAEFQARRATLLHRGTPVVITDLLRGQLLEQVTDLRSARELLGSLTVNISSNYIADLMEKLRGAFRGAEFAGVGHRGTATFAEYLDRVARNPTCSELVTEEATPAILLASLDLSALGVREVVGGYGRGSQPAQPTTAYSLLFAANAGNASDLHTDWDGRDVILFQGFGRKRVLLFAPEQAALLHPIDIYSTVNLAGMNDEERRAFLAYAGGVEHVLQPGEAIYIPAFTWHHVDYLDLALSISFRFGGLDDPNAIALMREMHRDRYVQNILAGTRNPRYAGASAAAARQLRVALSQPYSSARAKYRAMRSLAVECHDEIFPSAGRPPACHLLEVEDLMDGVLSRYYSDPPRNASLLERGRWRTVNFVRSGLGRLGRRLADWA